VDTIAVLCKNAAFFTGMSNGGAVAEHDSGYKSLFSHPEMVEDLLRGFVREDWVRDLDFSTLEKVPGNYVTPALSTRESDIVWRLRWNGDSLLYVYLLMEFQSTVDPSMALRMMVYLGLLYQDLLKRGETSPSGKLPPVLPLVLYNGYAPWGAAREISELIEEVPGGLEQYRPRLRYCLLDEMRMADSELEPLRNLAAAMFRLEKSRGTEAMERVLEAASEWLRAPGLEGVRRSFTDWVLKVLLPSRIRGVRFPESLDLEEVKAMLAESGLSWSDQWEQEGIEKGLQKGLQKALEQVRAALLRELERRFGPLPEEVRRRVGAIESIEDLTAFGVRAGSVSSIDELS
jgi:hypothetical protein